MRLWETITRRFQSPALMERMFALFHVREKMVGMDDEMAAKTLRAAAVRCMGCGHAQECDSWLGENKASAAPPSYCRNAELIARLGLETDSIH